MGFIRNTAVVFLVLNILGSSLMVPLIYLDFELRRDYIAEVLCINRDEPITVCGGKCYLDLRLEKATEHQESESATHERQPELSFFSQEVALLEFEGSPNSGDSSPPSMDDPCCTRSFIEDVFHPPRSC